MRFPASIVGVSLLLLYACAQPSLNKPSEPATPARWLVPPPDSSSTSGSVGWADLQLLALQSQALAANPDIAQARLRWQRAQGLERLAELDRGPEISATVESSLSRQLGAGAQSRSSGFNATVTQDTDIWGRLAGLQAAQAAQAEALRNSLAATQLLVCSQVAERYWSLVKLNQEEPLIEAQRKAGAEVLVLTRLRVREGKLQPIEIDRAASSLQAAHARAAALQRERLQHLVGLRLLLDDPGAEVGGAARLPPPGLALRPLDTPEQVLARRPDVNQARNLVDAALAQHQASAAARYPRLSFSAAADTAAAGWRDWARHPMLTLAANLVVPLVDWRRLDLLQTQARSELESAALALRSTISKVLVEVEELAAERRELDAQLQSQQALLNEAVRNEGQTLLRWQLGVAGRIDLLQVQVARSAAEQALLNLRLRQAVNHAGLVRAEGLK